LALSGGIGGAKLALGLYRTLPPGALTVVANTGDDFEHLGLSVSPDLDTLLYTLAGIDNPETGWGRRSRHPYRTHPAPRRRRKPVANRR
jgi:LPPG:FO 2-phospho-L-lactate transferase